MKRVLEIYPQERREVNNTYFDLVFIVRDDKEIIFRKRYTEGIDFSEIEDSGLFSSEDLIDKIFDEYDCDDISYYG